MRARYLVVGMLLGGGCLVPRYDYEQGAGGAAGAGAGNGNAAGSSAGSSVGSAGTSGAAGSSGAPSCSASQKDCGGACVELDDPSYGCTATSCDASACPVAGDGTLACEAGVCVVGSCGGGSKKCDGKCVSVDDPTYGCSETKCDGSVCPDAGGGTVLCNQGTCEIGTCTADTKPCDGKCVPKDRNNGCADPESCEPCDNIESCGSENAACECYATDPCRSYNCGEITDRCGKTWQCGDCEAGFCTSANLCVECLQDEHCVDHGNPCVDDHCDNGYCVSGYVPANTPCFGGGTCDEDFHALCQRDPVSMPGGGDIDRYEVTRGQYYKFRSEVVGAYPGLPAVCSWKTDHDVYDYLPAVDEYEQPVMGVDWCDAWAYCDWAGRRLCGKIGGGPVPFNDFAKPVSSQWMKACQGSGLTTFPYGNSAQAGACHDYSGADEPVAVGSYPMCQGGYAGVFDMSGSVHEWEDSCDSSAGQGASCRVRGGSFDRGADLAGDYSCGANMVLGRAVKNATVGIRCCSK